jgi:hypothetical protein
VFEKGGPESFRFSATVSQVRTSLHMVKAAVTQVGDLNWNGEKKNVIAHYGGVATQPPLTHRSRSPPSAQAISLSSPDEPIVSSSDRLSC